MGKLIKINFIDWNSCKRKKHKQKNSDMKKTNLYLLALSMIIMASAFKSADEHTAINKKDIVSIMTKVCDWQLSNMPDTLVRGDESRQAITGTSWVRATFFTGVMATYHTTGKKKYLKAAIKQSEKNEWKPGPRERHADDHCIGQTYIEIYEITQNGEYIENLKNTIDKIIEDPMRGPEVGWKFSINWGWCDALYMAPPVFAKLAQLTGERKYLDTMHTLWMDTYDHLYDTEENLYFRDDNYKMQPDGTMKLTQNGKKIFWSRGNGWVIGGLARVLEAMPEDYEHRPFYVEHFMQMSEKLAHLQEDDGLWRVSLIDPDEFPSPEVSGSAFFCYALAWGINNNILDKGKYLPIVLKAWDGLLWATDKKTGKIGYIQRIGHKPQSISSDDTAEYGVGAFLLAASELYKLVEQQ
jgi:unsaturated rhamnogalacturonyl hydrolase